MIRLHALPVHRDRGINLVELQITIAIMAILLVVGSLAAFGFSWKALQTMLLVPAGILGLSLVLSLVVGGVALVQEARAKRHARRVLRRLAEGAPGVDRDAEALESAFGVGELLGRARGDLAAALARPAPVRVAALRLLLKSRLGPQDAPIDADEALVSGAADWPQDTFVRLWRLARREETRLALARALLPRADGGARRALLEEMFGRFHTDGRARIEPAWLAALAPYGGEIRTLDAWHVDREHVSAFLRAFDPARAG